MNKIILRLSHRNACLDQRAFSVTRDETRTPSPFSQCRSMLVPESYSPAKLDNNLAHNNLWKTYKWRGYLSPKSIDDVSGDAREMAGKKVRVKLNLPIKQKKIMQSSVDSRINWCVPHLNFALELKLVVRWFEERILQRIQKRSSNTLGCIVGN